jgi:formamidopyrimidine-DNA glycosylase
VPELPEVETMARDLAPLVVGATIASAWFDWPKAIRYPDAGSFTREISGARIVGVGRRAKWIVVDLDGNRVFVIQVKMTGQLFVLPAGVVHDQHVHLRLELDGGPVSGGEVEAGPRWLLLRDVRKFARVGLYKRDSEGTILGPDDAGELFGDHGPEPLDDDFDVRAFRSLLRARRGRLKTTIMDQRFLAGVGNIYADEALWRARLHPLRSVSTLRPADERHLYDAIRDVLGEAIERRGSSVDDYTAPEGGGEMQNHLDAYQRTGLPCHRCGRPLRRLVLNARGTHFCSWCQRLPAADRTDANRALVTSATDHGRHSRSWTELGGLENGSEPLGPER